MERFLRGFAMACVAFTAALAGRASTTVETSGTPLATDMSAALPVTLMSPHGNNTLTALICPAEFG
jgi:hypothetical protein